jgi:hypothetical protein
MGKPVSPMNRNFMITQLYELLITYKSYTKTVAGERAMVLEKAWFDEYSDNLYDYLNNFKTLKQLMKTQMK